MKKTVLITGASGGLGKEIADALHTAEYSLALLYLNKKPDGFQESTDQVSLHKTDLRDESQIANSVHDCIQHHGKIDILINNAGVNYNAISWKIDKKEWDNVLSINLTAPMLCSKHVIPYMKKNNFGRIVNISSVLANTGIAGASAYAASKAGLWGLTKSLALETAKHNITVNQISPGYYNTGMIKELGEEQKNEIIKNIPKNKLGNSINLINCLFYLLQEESDYITGENIHINGGLF